MAKGIISIKRILSYTRIYQKKIKAFPRYADLRNLLGLLLFVKGKYLQAVRQFENALSINPFYEEAMVNRCFALSASGRRKIAIKDLKAFAKKRKKVNFWVYLSLSILSYQEGKSRESVAFIRKAIKKNPHDPYSLAVAGICHNALGHIQMAKRMLKKAQELSYVVARRHVMLDIYDSGKFFLKNIENICPYYIANPFTSDLFVRIAEEFAKADKMAESKELISFALSRGVATSRMLNFMGLLALKNKRETDAITLFHSAFARDVKNAYPAIHLFFIYGGRGQYKKAEEVLNETLRHNPGYADLHNYKGIYYLDMGQKKKALLEFRKALKINPWYLDALYNVAQVQEDIGQLSRAMDTYLRIFHLRKVSRHLVEKIRRIWSSMKPFSRKSFDKKVSKEARKDPKLGFKWKAIRKELDRKQRVASKK